jgi:hypothetical protein
MEREQYDKVESDAYLEPNVSVNRNDLLSKEAGREVREV